MTIEKLAQQIFDECAKDDEPVTMEEALEMAKMELGAKGMNRGAKAEDTPKKSENSEKKPKIVKVSDEKVVLFNEIWTDLYDVFRENAQIVKENKLISVKIGEKTFKIDIIEQRQPKK